MKVYEVNNKNQDNLLEELLKQNNLSEEQIIFKVTEKISGLFKSKSYTITAVEVQTVSEFIKDYLNELLVKMGLEVSFETSINGNQIYIKMSSNNNAILIGKNGQTLKALQTIIRQVVTNEINMLPYIILDVENYKDHQIQRLERLAVKVAKEVRNTGVEASLENMNSYERRIVHNRLADFKGVTTISEGQEPNRHVVIKKCEK